MRSSVGEPRRQPSNPPTPERLLELVDRMVGRRVVLVADLVVDRFVTGRPTRVSREAPVLILEQVEENLVPGGGGNAAANLQSLGGHPLVVGTVGDDPSGAGLLEQFQRRAIDPRFVLVRPGRETPTKTRILGGSPATFKQQIVRLDSGRNEPMNEAESAWIRSSLERAIGASGEASPVVVLSDYGYGTPEPFTGEALRTACGSQARIVVDSRHRLDRFRKLDGATPNLEEAEALAGRSLDHDRDLLAAGRELLDHLDCEFLLITRGSRGMVLFQRAHSTLLIPIHGTEQVADVTGAGDTVIGTLSLALAAGASVVEAALLANYAGGIVVLKAGTATVSGAELKAAVQTNPRLLEDLRWPDN